MNPHAQPDTRSLVLPVCHSSTPAQQSDTNIMLLYMQELFLKKDTQSRDTKTVLNFYSILIEYFYLTSFHSLHSLVIEVFQKVLKLNRFIAKQFHLPKYSILISFYSSIQKNLLFSMQSIQKNLLLCIRPFRKIPNKVFWHINYYRLVSFSF